MYYSVLNIKLVIFHFKHKKWQRRNNKDKILSRQICLTCMDINCVKISDDFEEYQKKEQVPGEGQPASCLYSGAQVHAVMCAIETIRHLEKVRKA